MIPPNQVNPAAANSLMLYLRQELFRAQAERQPLDRIWMKWHESYRAQPRHEVNDFPFEGASNLVIPVIATDVDIIYARLMAMYFSADSLWVCRPLRDDMVDFAPKLEQFLAWAEEHELNIYEPVADWLLETIKLGTGVLKTRYNREMKKVYEFREIAQPGGGVQTLERQARILLQDHPQVDHVPLWNFYVPSGFYEIQQAPWVAERLMLTWPQIVQRVQAGIYTNMERLGQWWARTLPNQIEQNLNRLDHFIPSYGDHFECHEFWLDYDIDADGFPEAIVVTVHIPTQTIMRLDYNPFFNQEKPYDFSRYLRVEKRLYGMGLCEMLQNFQDEVTAMHNQRLDSSTIANMSMYVALKTGNIKVDEPLFPGRILLVDSLDEIKPLIMGNGAAVDTIQNEQFTLNYARQRSGVNDFVAGNDSASANYATATTAVQQLREGAKRIDQTLRENRRCLSQVGMKVVELYQQFNQGGKPFMALGPQDGQLVQQVLNFPLDIIRSGVMIDVTAVNASNNKDTQMRTNMMLMQQLTQYYMQLMQAVQVAVNPQTPPQLRMIAADAARAGTILMRKILDDNSVPDPDNLVPNTSELFNAGFQQLNPLYAALAGSAPMGQIPGATSGVPAPMGGNPGMPPNIAGLLGAGGGAPQAPQGAGGGQYGQ